MELDALENDIFDIELNHGNTLAPQPERILVELKPHQRAALHKASIMERQGKIHYYVPEPGRYITQDYGRRNILFRGRFEIESNIGILGDIVGYGKTLTALSVIANTPVQQLHQGHREVFSCNSRTHSHFVGTYDKYSEFEPDEFIHTTLVIVPRGPVFVQWMNAVRDQTSLRMLVIEGLPFIRRELPPSGSTVEVLKAYFEQYDLVLIKSTTMKAFMDHYQQPYNDNPVRAWDRIMIDEAPDIITKTPLFGFKFLWLISATYESLLYRTYGSRGVMSYALRDILNEERMNLLLVKGNRAFVRESFFVPQPQEHYYLCNMPAMISAIHAFLSPSVQERINANDIPGAIRELGGKDETEEEIVHLLTREIDRDIRNKEREMAFVRDLDVSNEAREQRLHTLTMELARLNDKKQSMMERVSALNEKTCPICYDNFNNPIVLPCTHVFCGECLLHWMRSASQCPQCRAPIQSKKLIAVVKQKAPEEAPQTSSVLSKEDTLLKILAEKPNGKFLIFSKCDTTFVRLTQRLEREGISHMEIKGSTSTMMRILERFRNGELRVILLNTYHAGSGIDISCATDVVIFHSMGLDKMQAVGRAQRVGRTEQLHIHNLCYPNEMEEAT